MFPNKMEQFVASTSYIVLIFILAMQHFCRWSHRSNVTTQIALSVWVQILPGANLSGLEFCTRVHFDSWESFHKYSTGSREHFDVSGITVFFRRSQRRDKTNFTHRPYYHVWYSNWVICNCCSA